MSAGPGTIMAEVRIEAGRPRDEEFLVSDAFMLAKRQIFRAIQTASVH
jgi:hypothetical protein